MTDKETVRTSKFLSLILRHEPEKVGLKLGEAGWVAVDDLLAAVNRHGKPLTLDQLRQIVATSDKKRFAFNEDGTRIRASQGHSVEVDLQYPPLTPPEVLYHGTATRFLEGIRQHGLQKWSGMMCTYPRRRQLPSKSAGGTVSRSCWSFARV